MRKFTFFLCAVFLTMIGYSQGQETFANIADATGDGSGTSNSYQEWIWTGDNGKEWTATDARTDQTINDEAITVRNGELSTTISGGIGDLTLTTQRVFGGGDGDITVSVNGTEVGTLPYDDTEQTTTISGIDISGEATLLLETPGNGDRVVMDDLIWTEASGGGDCGLAEVPFTEGFENGIPDCWTVIDNDGQGETWTESDIAHTGDAGLEIHWEANAHDDYLISPQFTVTEGTSDQVRFFAGQRGATFDESFDVKISVSGNDPEDFTENLGSESGLPDAYSGEYEEFTYNLEDYLGEDIYIAVVATATNEFYLYLDDFSITTPPTCLEPTDITVNNITPNEADVSWTPSNDETQWTVIYGEPGFDPEEEGAEVSVTDNPETTLENLDSATSYDVYVRAVCSDTDESALTGPASFTTECTTVTSFPYAQNFDEVSTPDLPNCWTQNNANDDDDAWQTYTSQGVDGSQAAGMYTDYNEGDNDDYLISPQFTLTGNERLRFSVKVRSASEPDDFEVLLSTSDTDPDSFTEELLPVTTISSTEYQEYTIDLDDYTGDVYIAFHIPPSDTDGYYIYVDNFVAETIPSCLKPTDVMAEELTTTTADISWEAGADETQWTVIYGEPGFDPEEEGTEVSVTDDPETTLENLDPGTIYEVYVRADCSESDQSEWEGPISFATNCEATDIPFTQDFEDVSTPDIPICGRLETNVGDHSGDGWYTSNVTSYGFSGNVLRHDYSSSGSPDLDDWYFTQGINLEAGVNYQISFKYGSNSTLEEKLKVAYGSSPASSAMSDPSNEITDLTFEMQGSDIAEEIFQVDQDGIYYFGFQIHSGANKYYLYIDDIHIDLGPTCLQPTDLAVDNIGPDSADISWEAGDSETEWEVAYGEEGFDIDNEEGELVTVNDDPETTLENLDTDTTYDVYVRAVCAEDNESEWIGPLTFTAECSMPETLINKTYSPESATGDCDADYIILESAVSEIVYQENFDGGGSLSNFDWTENSDGSDNWKVTSSNDAEGENAGELDFSGNSMSELTATVESPSIDISDESNLSLSWKQFIKVYNSDVYPMSVFMETSVDEGDWEVAWSIDPLENQNYGPETIDVDLSSISGNTLKIRFKINGETFGLYDWFIDDVVLSSAVQSDSQDIEWMPTTGLYTDASLSTPYTGDSANSVYVNPEELSETTTFTATTSSSTNDCETTAEVTVIAGDDCLCSDIEDIEISEIDAHSANVTWTENKDAEEWIVYYGEQPFTPDENSDSETVNGTPEVILTNLNPDTTYEVYVQPVCDEDLLVGPVDFTTEVAPCEAPEGLVVDNVTDSSAEVTWLPGMDPGETDGWEVVYGEEGFDPDTEGESITTQDPLTTLENLDPDTTYDVYVRTICDEGNEVYSEWDGSVTFTTEQAPCETPTDITFNNNDDNSIDVSWTPAGNETQWEVLYGESGFNPESEGQSLMVNDQPEVTLEDLQPEVSYDVYVRAVCSEDNVSDWTEPKSFLDVDRQIFENFTFYPNPVQNNLTLKAGRQIENVILFNMLGQTIIEIAPHSLQAQLNTEDLQSGVYLIKVRIDGTSQSFRIVKK